MAKITVTFNGNVVTDASESDLAMLAAIAGTDNPGAKTVSNAVLEAGGEAYVDLFAANGDSEDSFVIVKEITRGGKKGKITASGTRSVIAERMRLALRRKTWQTTIVTQMEDESNGTDSDATPTPVRVW